MLALRAACRREPARRRAGATADRRIGYEALTGGNSAHLPLPSDPSVPILGANAIQPHEPVPTVAAVALADQHHPRARAQLVGIVEAKDAEAAVQVAVKQFNVSNPDQRKRLAAYRVA